VRVRMIASRRRVHRRVSFSSPATLTSSPTTKRLWIAPSESLPGFVTATRLSCDASQDGRRLGGHRRGVPLLHRLGSEEAQRAAGDQMALTIERVVDDGMHGEEALSRSC
jgi:hypothetical protein